MKIIPTVPARENEITRVEAFSDGMIAFAATLLVVSMDPPRTFDDLTRTLYGFIPFGLSFIALFYIWVVHTILFRRYPLTDKASIFINGVLLFTVLFYVQPLRFLASSFVSLFSPEVGGSRVNSWEQLQSLFMIYSAGWVVIFLLVAWLYQRAHATRESLGLTPVEAYDAITYSRHYLGFVAAGVLSVIVAYAGIGIGFGLPGLVYSSIGFFVWLNLKNREPGRKKIADKVAEHPQLAYTGAIRTDEIQHLIR
ncbi:MAG TPA: TMEM175 family protein [Gemmatimonadaceae bacterium]